MTRAGVVLAAALLAACAAQGPDFIGPPIAVPAGLSPERVDAAIRSAIRQRNKQLSSQLWGWRHGATSFWSVEESAPGRLVAGLRVRVHYLRLEIRYTDADVTTEIIDSQNLDQDVDSIHPRALAWQTGLEDSIATALRFAAASAAEDLSESQ